MTACATVLSWMFLKNNLCFIHIVLNQTMFLIRISMQNEYRSCSKFMQQKWSCGQNGPTLKNWIAYLILVKNPNQAKIFRNPNFYNILSFRVENSTIIKIMSWERITRWPVLKKTHKNELCFVVPCLYLVPSQNWTIRDFCWLRLLTERKNIRNYYM